MALMTDIKRFFQRTRPATTTEHGEVDHADLHGTQADGLVAAMRDQQASSDLDQIDDSGDWETSPAGHIVEPKPEKTESRSIMSRLSGNDSKRNTEEIMGLIRRMNDHLDEQSVRTERLLTLMERLPDALQAIPELNRRNSQIVEIITDHLDHARTHESTIEQSMTRISDASEHQSQLLTAMRSQLETGQESTERMTTTLGRLNSGLSDLARTNETSVETLSRMNDSAEQRETALAEALGRTQRWMMATTIVCGSLAAGACIIAAIALLR